MAVAVAAPLVVISTSVVVVAPVMAAVVVTVVVHDEAVDGGVATAATPSRQRPRRGAGEFPVRCCDSLRIRSDFVRGHLEFFIANAHNPDAL